MKINTKSMSKNIDTLLAKCENTFDLAIVTNAGQQAEAYARIALREAKNARGSFDDGQFQYVQASFVQATEARLTALEYMNP